MRKKTFVKGKGHEERRNKDVLVAGFPHKIKKGFFD